MVQQAEMKTVIRLYFIAGILKVQKRTDKAQWGSLSPARI